MPTAITLIQPWAAPDRGSSTSAASSAAMTTRQSPATHALRVSANMIYSLTVGLQLYEVVVMREPGDYLRHGDYEPWGAHGIRLIAPKTCYRDHPVTGSSGFGECPRCGVPTNVWWCAEQGCD